VEQRARAAMVSTRWRVVADLAVVQTELVLADLEVLLHRPAQARDPDQGAQRDSPSFGRVTVEIGQAWSVGSVRLRRTSR
ncbi:MAG: hypothetical protein ACRDSN_22175, partial [Pseudonocardiaceae bacterium]